jgi:hypothetical protein
MFLTTSSSNVPEKFFRINPNAIKQSIPEKTSLFCNADKKFFRVYNTILI